MKVPWKGLALGCGGVLLALVVLLGVTVGPSIYRIVFHAGAYDHAPPDLPSDLPRPAILVFSKTNGFRDGAQIDAANAMFRDIAGERGWAVFVTENGAVFNARDLELFDAVVWNSVSGDVLTEEQRAAFRSYLEGGGGFVGTHGSGGDPEYKWRWYVDDLIGAQFIGHTLNPHIQRATIRIEDQGHPAMAALGATWSREDEWYAFSSSVRGRPGYHVLANADESSYRPTEFLGMRSSMGADHPLIWWHCVGAGRAFYSALGHTAESYAEPKHRQMLANAIAWTINGEECRS